MLRSRSVVALLFLAVPVAALDPPAVPPRPSSVTGPRGEEMLRLSGLLTPVASADRTLGELTFTEVEVPATSAAFALAPDGKSVVGTADALRASFEAFVISLPEGKVLKTLSGAKENPLGRQRAIAFTPDGRKVVGVRPGIRVWDVQTGKLELSVDWRWERDAVAPGAARPPVVPAAPVISLDATRAYVCGPKGEVIAWDLTTGKELERRAPERWPVSFSISPDGKQLAIGLSHGFRVWDTTTFRDVLAQDLQDEYRPFRASWYVSYAPDGRLFISGPPRQSVQVLPGGARKIWDAPVIEVWEKGKLTGTVQGLRNPTHISFLPGGRYALVVTDGYSVIDLKKLEPVGRIAPRRSVAFSGLCQFSPTPDGKAIIGGSGSGIERLVLIKAEDLLKLIPAEETP